MPVLDTANPEHATALQRLQDDQVAWLTTVSPSGRPQSSPIWFLLLDHGGHHEALVLSQPHARKVRNLRANAQAGLHLNGDEHGGHIVTLEGPVEILPEWPADDVWQRYLVKYERGIESIGYTVETFQGSFSTPLLFEIARARAWVS